MPRRTAGRDYAVLQPVRCSCRRPPAPWLTTWPRRWRPRPAPPQAALKHPRFSRQRSARMGRRRALELCRPRHRRVEIPALRELAQSEVQRRLLRLHQGDRGRRPRRQLFRRALAARQRPPASRAAPIISTISAALPPSRRAGSSRTCPTTARPCRRCWTWNGTRIRRPAS